MYNPYMEASDMIKKIRNIMIISLTLILLAAIAVVIYITQRIPMNPPGTIGNTAGNLNNSGLFCEYNGTVYFSNTGDGGCLYAMNSDETNVRKLADMKVMNILAGGSYLYYFQTGTATTTGFGFSQLPGMHTFNRSSLDGKDTTAITADVVVMGQLVDNYLYLLTTSNSVISFYKIKIDQTDKVELADYNINPACAQNGVIYYSGTNTNHYLYALNTANDTSIEFWRGNLWYPALEGDYIYYLDVAEGYRLCRYSISQDSIQVLTEDRVDCYNIAGGYIYYQKNSVTEPQLKCMRTDGSEVQVIAEGNYTNINMTSRYVYFQEFGDDTTMYHSPLGSSSYSIFSSAAH